MVVSDPNRLELFAVGAGDDALWHKRLVGDTWETWENLTGMCNSAPVGVSAESKGVNVFCVSADSDLRTNALRDNKWSGWTGLHGLFALSL